MNEDKVISKEELLEKLWNDKYYIDENVLLVNMTRLKKKMKENYTKSERKNEIEIYKKTEK